MDSQLCRLCLQTSEDVVNIWRTFQDSTVATILAKHFWFLQINEDDGLPEWLCQVCWEQTENFHDFYRKVEAFQKSHWDRAKSKGGDNEENVAADAKDVKSKADFTIGTTELKLKPIDSRIVADAINTKLKPDLIIEETELNLKATDSHPNQENVSSGKYDGGEVSKISNVKSKPVDKKTPQIDDSRTIRIRLKTSSFRQSDELINKTIREEQNRELNGQIREFFTMKCDMCNVGDFDTLLDVRRHYRREHQTVGYLKCCDRKFHRRCDLLDHMRYHILTPESTKVNAKIYDWFTMKCDICNNVTFTTLLDVRRHYRNVHKVRGYLVCCDKKYVKRHAMVAHMRSHTNPDAFHCEQCDRSFSTKQSLKNHIAHHVPLDSRAFKCHLCSSSFAIEAILKVHIRNKHTSKNGQKFPCDKCNKNYRSELLLKCHVRQSHENSMSYVCEVCARQFKSKQTLLYHFKGEHSTTPQPKVQCDICGNWLKNESNLTRHVKEQHQDAEPTNCHICNKVLLSKLRLRKHISFVHGEKNHRCTLCEKTFCRSKALKEHVATHTGEDLYKCKYCEKKWKSSANLSSHMKKAHFVQWSRNNEKKMSAFADKEIVRQVKE